MRGLRRKQNARRGRRGRWKRGNRGKLEGIHSGIHWRVEVPGDVRGVGDAASLPGSVTKRLMVGSYIHKFPTAIGSSTPL